MDTQRNEQPGWQSEGESLNTGSTENTAGTDAAGQEQEERHEEKKGGIHNNALYAASLGRSASAQVHRHSAEGLEQTGTNPGYETPIAPGAGGSVGTGFASGQEAVNPTISTDSDYDLARVGHKHDGDEATDENETDRPADEAADGL